MPSSPSSATRSSLTEADWATLLDRLGPYESWSAGKAGAAVEKLGLKRVREILASKAKEKLTALIAEDKKLEPEFAAIASVEKLVRYHRDLYRLCHNFVSFRDFYSRKEKAIFQAGTLYLDQRSCDLCLTVEDPGKHGLMAALAGTYLAYCDCVRKGTDEKLQILAAFTDGDSDNLMVGRNGLFYDRKGRDWDATITKIMDNPISIRQAFWAPYKKVARFINEQVAKRAAAADAQTAGKLAQAALKAGQSWSPARPSGTGTAASAAETADGPRHDCCLGRGRSGHRRHGGRHCQRLPEHERTHAAGHTRRHSPHLRPVHAHGLAQTAQAQPRPHPGRQRLGGECQGQDQRALRPLAHPGRRVAAGRAAQPG